MPLISISSKGLNKLKNNFYENNFKFIINNQEENYCPKLLSDFMGKFTFNMNIKDFDVKNKIKYQFDTN